MLNAVLVANRGEIALRVLRTCRRLGIRGIAVYSDADSDAPFVRYADEAIHIGPAPASASYLRVDKIVAAAVAAGADAVHPGYGFLSENPLLAEALAAAGIAFVGPSPDVIRLMGDKAAAKLHLAAAGVPVVPGIEDVTLTDAELLARLPEVGVPLLLKAVAGGGGKGMRAVHDLADAPAALAAAKREAMGAFGDDRMIVEKLITNPRHVEVQVMGDTHGNVIHVLERDCSLQRRHQKVVEEAPAAHLADDVRAALLDAAVKAAKAVDYVGAGTVEFLLDGNGRDVYFLEMNTRLQVEHPVTEIMTGLDLVELQLRAAAGLELGVAQDQVVADGHAMEIRLYAEDPAVGFLPQTGTLLALELLEQDHDVRFDSGIEQGSVVSPHYDPMLAKLIVHGPSRPAALGRLMLAISGLTALGVRHNLEWLGDLLAVDAVQDDTTSTSWLDAWDWSPPPLGDEVFAAAAAALAAAQVDAGSASPWEAVGARRNGAGGWVVHLADGDDQRRCTVRQDVHATEVSVTSDLAGGAGTTHLAIGAGVHWSTVINHDATALRRPTPTGIVSQHSTATALDGDTIWVHESHRTRALTIVPATRHVDLDAVGGDAALVSPMPGAVVTVEVAEGDVVTKGQTLLVVEAMKMEHPITAPTDGTVVGLKVTAGDAVQAGEALVTVHPHDEPSEA